MTTAAYAPGIYSPTPWPDPPWRRWVDEVGMPVADATLWALGMLLKAAALLIWATLVWPSRRAWHLARGLEWRTGEAAVSAVVLGCPAAMLIRVLPRVHWPTLAEAAADLRQAGAVLLITYLVLVVGFVQANRSPRGVGPRPCSKVHHCGPASRAFVPGPQGRKTNRTRWLVAVHEAGHLVVGRKLGRRTGRARITGTRSGQTWVAVKRKDPIGEIAIDMAGGYAAGTWEGCDGDKAHAHHRLRTVPKSRHGEYMRRGHAKSSRLVRENKNEIVRVAGHVYRKGHFAY